MARTKQDGRKGSKAGQRIDREPRLGPESESKIPKGLRFPLVAFLSLSTSLALRSVSSPFSSGDLGTVTTQRDDWLEIVGFVGWRIAELATTWWLDYDGKGKGVTRLGAFADALFSVGRRVSDVLESPTVLLSIGALL